MKRCSRWPDPVFEAPCASVCFRTSPKRFFPGSWRLSLAPILPLKSKSRSNVRLICSQGIRTGRLDLALLFSREKLDIPSTRIGRLPMKWVVYPGFRPEESVRMVLFAAPCLFRDTAAALLGQKEWKQTFSSSSLAGTWAAVEAGLGITLRTELGIPDHLETLSRLPGTGRLPMVDIVLLQSRTTPVVSRLKDCLVQRGERIMSADRRVGVNTMSI